MHITAFDIAQVFVGTDEVGGAMDNPQILAMLKLDNNWPENDEVPWCSAFVNYVCKLLRLPRSKSLLARSWLEIGSDVSIDQARVGFDVVVLRRGTLPQPGPENTTAPGHVGFYAGHSKDLVQILGGNQSNTVKVSYYQIDRILSIRRLHDGLF